MLLELLPPPSKIKCVSCVSVPYPTVLKEK
jgi:hypothetical protein